MTSPVTMVEIWRGALLESFHQGHAVVADGTGQIVESWGDPGAVIYPRSSAKMIQALPLISSGAADRYGLSGEQLALACASHNGAAIHTSRVRDWLEQLGLDDSDLRCGPQIPDDEEARNDLVRQGRAPVQMHNNCSGKHSGFLTLAQYMGAGPEYIEIDHPVQQAALAAFEEVTGEASQGYGIDGCSAPNFTTTMGGMARAMAWFATASERSDQQSRAAARLVEAMGRYPELVAGEGRCCTALMRAGKGRFAVKTGAEGFFIAILPEQKLGIALKIADGAGRASECAITALLARHGALAPDDPVVRSYTDAPITNRRGLQTGRMRAVIGSR